MKVARTRPARPSTKATHDMVDAVGAATLTLDFAYERHPELRPLLSGLAETYAAQLVRRDGAPLEERVQALRAALAELNDTLAGEILRWEREYRPGAHRFARGLRLTRRHYSPAGRR
jgi:hypothetical protein